MLKLRLYVDNPLITLFKDEMPYYRETEFIERQNREWRERGGKAKEGAIKMLSIDGVLPMTPHARVFT